MDLDKSSNTIYLFDDGTHAALSKLLFISLNNNGYNCRYYNLNFTKQSLIKKIITFITTLPKFRKETKSKSEIHLFTLPEYGPWTHRIILQFFLLIMIIKKKRVCSYVRNLKSFNHPYNFILKTIIQKLSYQIVLESYEIYKNFLNISNVDPIKIKLFPTGFIEYFDTESNRDFVCKELIDFPSHGVKIGVSGKVTKFRKNLDELYNFIEELENLKIDFKIIFGGRVDEYIKIKLLSLSSNLIFNIEHDDYFKILNLSDFLWSPLNYETGYFRNKSSGCLGDAIILKKYLLIPQNFLIKTSDKIFIETYDGFYDFFNKITEINDIKKSKLRKKIINKKEYSVSSLF